MEDIATTMLILMLGPTVIGLTVFGLILISVTAVKVVKGLKNGDQQ